MMERNKIKRPEGNNSYTEKPKRKYPVTPSGLSRPEMVQQASTKPQIVENPSTLSELHTDTPRRKPRFEERYTRVTTYLENGLNQRLRRVTWSGDVSITNIVNAALRAYLKARYPES